MPGPTCAGSARIGGRRPARALLALAAALVTGWAVACQNASRDRPTAAPSPFRAADSLKDEGRYHEALERYGELADSLAPVGDTAGLWRARLWESYSLVKVGELEAARAGLRRAGELAGDGERLQGWTHWVRSVLLDRQGRFEPALAEAERTLALARDADDPKLEAAAYNALGRIHSLRGRYREALEVHQRLLELRRRPGNPPRSRAVALNEIGIDYRHLGRLRDAVHVYQEALRIYRRLEDPEGVAMVLYNLSNVHLSLGEIRTVREERLDALHRVEAIGHVRGQGFLHNGLGDLYLQIGNHAAARRHLERALEVNREARLAYGELLARANLGRLELADGRPAEAEDHLTAALAAADSAGFGKERATVRTGLARLEARRGNGSVAVRWAREAVALADSLGDPEVRYEALETLGAAREAAGRGEDAGDGYLRGVELLESWRGRLALGDLRMGVTDLRIGAYEGAIRALVAGGEGAEAFELAERARARLLLELMARGEASEPAPETVDDEARISRIRRRLRTRYVAWTEVGDAALEGGDGATAGDGDGLPPELREMAERLERLEAEARRREPAAGAARWPQPRTLEEIRRGLVGPDRAILAYFWGERDVYGWWVGREGVRARRLGHADSLAALVGFLRTAVTTPESAPDWKPSAHRAFRRLVSPLEPGGAAEVLLLPDGPLAKVPFEVFLPEPEGPPWGAGRRLVYGPSASVLDALASREELRGWARGMLAVGNPIREADDGGGEPPGSTPPARGPGPRADSFPSLPHAAREARTVAELFAPVGSDLLVGRRASVDEWRSLRPARYRYLHFATHARVDDRRPEGTFVLLSGGRLELPRIRRLRLDAELVTLSACETGLGRRVRGEGVIGLPHAFLAAGARGVVVSLWRVRDRAAADFMVDFYGRLRRGLAPAEALRRTRRAWIEDGGARSHPSAWAPFVLVGGLEAAPPR